MRLPRSLCGNCHMFVGANVVLMVPSLLATPTLPQLLRHSPSAFDASTSLRARTDMSGLWGLLHLHPLSMMFYTLGRLLKRCTRRLSEHAIVQSFSHGIELDRCEIIDDQSVTERGRERARSGARLRSQEGRRTWVWQSSRVD